MDIKHGAALQLRDPHPGESETGWCNAVYTGTSDTDGVTAEREHPDGGTMRVTHVVLTTGRGAAEGEPWGSWVAYPAS